MLRDGTLLHIPRAERDKHTLLQHVEELMDMVDFCKIEELNFNGVAWNLRVSKPAYTTARDYVSFWAKECNAGLLSDPEQAQDALEMLVAVTMKKLQRPTSLEEHIAEFTHIMSKPREWQLQIIHSWVIWPNHLLQNVLQLGHAYRQQDRCEDALVMYASAIMHAPDVNPKQAFIGNIHGFVPSKGGRVINAEAMVSIAHMMASGKIAPNFGKVLNLCNAALAIDCRMLSPVYYVRAVVYANGNTQINMQMCANVIIPHLFQKMSTEGMSSQAGKALLCYELSLWPNEQTLALMRCVKSQAAKFPREYADFQVEFNKMSLQNMLVGKMCAKRYAELLRMMEAAGILMDHSIAREKMLECKRPHALSPEIVQTSTKHFRELVKQAKPDLSDAQEAAVLKRFQSLLTKEINRCTLCSKEFPGLLKCSLCKDTTKTYYCSKECQLQHWGEHRKVCSGYLKQRAQK